jgi:signal transduction histidine kinase
MENTIYMSSNADKVLSHANDVIGRFITSCSHSMRGPLKSIAGLVNLLQNNENCTPQDRQLFLDLIARSSLKMENMLDELEHFLENTKRDTIVQKIDLQRIIEGILDSHRKQIDALDLRVTIDINAMLDFHSDPHRLRLILVNLIENALHFHDPEKKEKTLRIHATNACPGIQLAIADNGIGIEKESQSKIFQLFYRGSERSGGAGIGLHVVNEVVKKMGGTIVVDSRPGIGTQFIMHLPDLETKKVIPARPKKREIIAN